MLERGFSMKDVLPDLDRLRERDRRGGGLRDLLGDRDREGPNKIVNPICK